MLQVSESRAQVCLLQEWATAKWILLIPLSEISGATISPVLPLGLWGGHIGRAVGVLVLPPHSTPALGSISRWVFHGFSFFNWRNNSAAKVLFHFLDLRLTRINMSSHWRNFVG